MKRSTSLPPVELVPVPKITVDGKRDSKKDAEKIKELKESFKEHGQLAAIILFNVEGSSEFVLQSGWKRLEAAKALKWEEIKATVIRVGADYDLDLIREWTRLIEEHQKYALDHYDLAHAAVVMETKHKIKGSEFARQLGLSNGYIYNLMRWYRSIPEPVREAWKNNNPLINQAELERYSHMQKSDALEAWQLRVRMKASAFEPFMPDKNGKNGKKATASEIAKAHKPRRASERQIAKLQQALDESPLIDSAKELGTNILKFVLGVEKNVAGITDYRKLPLNIISKEAASTPPKDGPKNGREHKAA
jgi:ParB/RepB/Spo0J family partition protein